MSFFAPPRRIESSIFTRMPDHFRKLRHGAWADANRGGQAIDCFLEGPSFDRDGRLYVVDIPNGRVFRIDQAGTWEQVAEYDGWPNGLKIHRDGRIFIADYKRGLMLLEPASGAVTPFLETVASESFKGVNDLVFGRSGTLYFTDQGQTGMHDPTGRVYRLTPDGRLTCLLGTVPSPNGIVVDANESFLLVAVTRANQVWRVPLLASGLTVKVGVFAHLHGGTSGPDGLALDADGCLLIAHAGFGSIWRLSSRAEPLERVVSCAGYSITNMAFGGPGGTRLFITESETGSILQADMPAPGLALYSHQSADTADR
jgi:gluconolactonase